VLRDACAAGDRDGFVTAAHSLKSNAVAFGALRLADSAQRLEWQGDATDAGGLVVEENNLQVQISGLRRVLGSRSIATVAGQGYRFTLAPGSTAMTAPPVDQRVGAGRERAADVLVADDNRVHRLLLCRSLELLGHCVKGVENGREALATLRAEHVDLLLLDLAMPELDGFALLQARADDARLREVAVIVTSALDGVAPVARCIELGADDFLHKPVDPWLLKARVASSLALKHQRDLQAQVLQRLAPALPDQASRLPDAWVLAARLRDAGQVLVPLAATPAMELPGTWGTLMRHAIDNQGGQLVRFDGDALLALFGDALAAQRAAQDMADLTMQFNAERAAQGQPALQLDQGLARGPVWVGAAQVGQRASFVCLGAAVRRSERLASDCARQASALLVDDAMQA
jgi:DNA-binding response OmpR family regulator